MCVDNEDAGQKRHRGRFEAPVGAVVALLPQKVLVVRPRRSATPRRINCQLRSDFGFRLRI